MKAVGKEQDKELLDAIEAFLRVASTANVAAVVRVHERNLTVAFPDGRTVSLVLYGPRGKA